MVYTTRDIAQKWAIHYESCRAYIERHKEEIEGEYYKKGKTTYFTDKALEILEEGREGNPVVVQNIEADAVLKMLQAKVLEQSEKIAAQAEELREMDKKLADNNIKLLEAQNEAQRADKEAQRANTLEEELKALKADLEAERGKKYSFKEWWREKRK